ncbi:RNA-directed DNA polymerase, eukaryota [Tanacetum coccineum]
MFTKDHVSISDYFVALMGTWIPSSSKLLIISVYAPQELSEKRALWDYLHLLISRWDGETVLMGDFNEVRSERERFGYVFNQQGANVFNHFITSNGLIDPPLDGYAFTWTHMLASKMSKLDRFLFFEGLLESFPHLSAICLDKHLFDHRPILLRETSFDYGPTPFRFFHSWFIMEGFDSFVESTWNSFNIVEENGLIRLKKKLQLLKIAIKAWMKDARMKSNEKKSIILKKLADLDRLIDQGRNNDEILNSRILLLNDLHDINSKSASELAQKAKIHWSIEGDENSKFFHGVINKKRSQLAIRGILVDGNWISEPTAVKNEFFKHFQKQFSPPQSSSFRFDFVFPTRLSSDQVDTLECDVSYDEIKAAVWDCGTDKTPGPDGFSFEFFRRYWSFINQDVLMAVKAFFLDGQFPRGCNSSFTALIPKIQEAKWCKWISGCLNNARGSVLVNGNPTSEFQFFKGLKQGDPLSPFLFILIMETLHLSFKRILSAGLYKGISITRSFMISHLFYADDVIFVGEWNDKNIQTLLNVLKCFYLASGLKINLHKIKLMGIGVNTSTIESVANLIGCAILHPPFNYLGVKVGCNMNRISSWDKVISKVSSRLSKWKLKSLSIGGRLTLLKSVLTSIPLYHMSIYRVPLGVLQKLESVRKNFFNVALILKWMSGHFFTDDSSFVRPLLSKLCLVLMGALGNSCFQFHVDRKKIGAHGENTSCWDG